MRMIWVSFDVIGFHFYPNAPDEVAYLRDNHRHVFKFKVGIEVSADNREIEFHTLKRELLALYKGEVQFGAISCEHIAANLLHRLVGHKDYSHFPGATAETKGFQRKILVDVSEDGECGGIVSNYSLI